MTRIDAHNEMIAAQREHEQMEQAQQRNATLHHGTSFAYGSNSPHGRMMRSLRMRQLQMSARLRAMLMKRKSGAQEEADAEAAAREESIERRPSERDGDGNERQRAGDSADRSGHPRIKTLMPNSRHKVNRRQDDGRGSSGGGGGRGGDSSGGSGGSGGGNGNGSGSNGGGGSNNGNGEPGGGRGQGRDDDGQGEHLDQSLDAIARSGHLPIGGMLGEMVAQAGMDGVDALHSDAFGTAWIDDIHALLSKLASNPGTDFQACALELNLSWLHVQEGFGRHESGGIARFIERAPPRGAIDSGETDPLPASTQEDPDADSRSTPRQAERLRDARVLAPLLSLNGNHPRRAAWLARATARLEGMQALTRCARLRATTQEHTLGDDAPSSLKHRDSEASA